ncbi:hypothetical protein R3P38DRAFT_2857494 [Favolaschia claudopus]|uniref:Uncharacterized protein n=1 Tax=Favolaschia claudopus TaxID=2862362 RepID=A0AAW0DJX2_9AGAR
MLYDALPTSAAGKTSSLRRHKRRYTYLCVFATLVVVGFLSFAVRTEHVQSKLAEIQLQLCTPGLTAIVPEEQTPRMYLRVGPLGGEGMGSVLQHFKQSIVLSQVLDSSLRFGWNEVWDHRYSQSEIYNTNAGSVMLDPAKACRIQDFIPHEDRDGLVRSWCAGDDSTIERLDAIKARMADCTSILDTEVDELTQDLNGCIMPWVRSRLIPPPSSSSSFSLPSLPYSSNPSRRMSVGIHIRWGDTAPPPGTDIFTHDFYGSMNFPDIARVLTDLRAFSSNPLEITIAMEEADRAVIALLNLEAEEYTLLDSPQTQALDDLRVLSRSDVLLLGESSYGVLTHLLAPPGGKFRNTSGFGRHVVYLDDYTKNVVNCKTEIIAINLLTPRTRREEPAGRRERQSR